MVGSFLFGSGSDPIVMDHWAAAPGTTPVASVVLQAGQRLPIRFDCEDAEGDSTCRMGWRKPPVSGETASADEIRDWTNDRLAKYQRLSRLILRTDFPRATYGKIQKDKLREEYAELFSGQG